MLIAIPKALSLRAVRSYGRDKLVPSLMKFLGVFIRSGSPAFQASIADPTPIHTGDWGTLLNQ
jgi:hypothetical protein